MLFDAGALIQPDRSAGSGPAERSDQTECTAPDEQAPSVGTPAIVDAISKALMERGISHLGSTRGHCAGYQLT
ncbi:hypothetical protein GCM10009768_20070 [Leucobacter iarius]|uniref:Uncharacterized protein n=1 Tax=Leucobacter iarius TaxID=333963 RepID=A0ABN2LJP3_9MICO